MPVSLDTVMVGTYDQLLPAAAALIDKAEQHAKDNGIAEADMIATRLADDMFTLGNQFEQVMCHTAKAIEGVRTGKYYPGTNPVTGGFEELRGFIKTAQEAVSSLAPGELDSLAANEVVFTAPGREMPFVAEDFLLSFTLPNFYFHLTTAYDILRNQGLPLSKLDFIGRMRIKS